MTETFEVGQKAQCGGEDVTVTYGPYTSALGFTRYVVRMERGGETTVRDVQLSAIPETPKFAVGDVTSNMAGTRRYTIDGGPHTDDRGVWYAATNPEGQTHKIYADDLSEIVKRVTDENTYTHDGVTYDLTARYRDTDGDTWKFARIDGEVRGNYTSRPIEEWDETLAGVVRSYGPLTRV